MATSTEHTLYVGPANCEILIGIPWRRAKEIAIRLGVQRVRAGKTLLLPVGELRAALERAGDAVEPPSPADAERAVLDSLARNREATG